MNGFAQAVEKSKIAYKNAGAFFFGAFFFPLLPLVNFLRQAGREHSLEKLGVLKFNVFFKVKEY